MEPRKGETFVSPTEETVPFEDERELPPPRFDEKSVQRARPAVPLGQRVRARARSGPSLLVVLCVLGGVAGGVLGGLALTLYQRGPRAEQRTAAARTESEVAQTAAPAQPSPQEVKPAADGAAAAAPPATATRPAAVPAQPDTAARTAEAPPRAEEATPARDEPAAAADAGTQQELRAALGEWLAATNSRDVGRQMSYYAPKVEAFYLSRNAPREAVRAEKARLFARAASVNVEAASPEIRMSRDGRTAVMRFRKRYQITGGEGARSGEVLQELRWRRTDGGWKIVGERDLRVLQ
ncbi:MAG TPA: nuclear transport factor 2 family protein [Pyrinomonadaceae bacterium]|jgi:ketosteroid isomerase-like protein